MDNKLKEIIKEKNLYGEQVNTSTREVELAKFKKNVKKELQKDLQKTYQVVKVTSLFF